MPTAKSKRNYKKEYARDHAPKKDKDDRVKRNAANRKKAASTSKAKTTRKSKKKK